MKNNYFLIIFLSFLMSFSFLNPEIVYAGPGEIISVEEYNSDIEKYWSYEPIYERIYTNEGIIIKITGYIYVDKSLGSSIGILLAIPYAICLIKFSQFLKQKKNINR